MKPFRPTPTGLLCFHESLHFVELISDPSVPRFVSNVREAGTAEEEEEAAVIGKLAFFGTYTLDGEGNFTGNLVQGCTFPNWIGDQRTAEQSEEVVDRNDIGRFFKTRLPGNLQRSAFVMTCDQDSSREDRGAPRRQQLRGSEKKTDRKWPTMPLKTTAATAELVPVSQNSGHAAAMGLLALAALESRKGMDAAMQQADLVALKQMEAPKAVLLNQAVPALKILVRAARR